MPWLLRRTDDNGNVFVIERNMTLSAAYARLVALEARGHKQCFEVREDRPAPALIDDALGP